MVMNLIIFIGIDDDDEVSQPEASTSAAPDMPPLEGAEEDATRMEEVDWRGECQHWKWELLFVFLKRSLFCILNFFFFEN